MKPWQNLSYCNGPKNLKFTFEDGSILAVPVTNLGDLTGPWKQQSMRADVNAILACDEVTLVFLGDGYEFAPVDVYLGLDVFEQLVKDSSPYQQANAGMIAWEALSYCPTSKNLHVSFADGTYLTMPLSGLKNLKGFGRPEWIAELVDAVLADPDAALAQYCSVVTFEPPAISFGVEMIEELIRQSFTFHVKQSEKIEIPTD